MSKIFYFLIAIGLSFTSNNPVAAKNAKVLELGAAVPMADFSMKGTDGKTHSIDSIKGKKGALVIFSCNSCPWAVKWEDRVAAIGNEYHKKGVGVVVINPNDPERASGDGFDEMIARAKKLGYKFPYVADPASVTARAFGATRTPEVFLFNAKGKLVYHGAVDDNASDPGAVEAAYLKDALNALVSGNAIPVAQTKALGCTIKFSSDS